MNHIEEAAALLENGWCRGDLLKQDERDADAHCAVGALTSAMGIIQWFDNVDEAGPGELGYFIDDEATYAQFNATPEGKALADEIMESQWFAEQTEEMQKWLTNDYQTGAYSPVVFTFNDGQEDKESVIEMFKHAAKRLY